MKRKKSKYIAIVVLMTAGMVFYLEACKKDAVTPIINNTILTDDYPEYTEEAKIIVGKIKKFKSQLIDKENVIRSGLEVPVDSAIWNVEALLNAEYASPDRKYLETVKQDLEIYVNVNNNNTVSFGDVADFYDEMKAAVRQVYSGDGINEDKSLMAIAIDQYEREGSSVKVNVHVVSGRIDNKTVVGGYMPFGPGDCWYYGEYGGSCDDPTVFCDAAEIIEDSINYNYGGLTVPTSGYRVLCVNFYRTALNGDEYFDDLGLPFLYFYSVNNNPPYYLDYDLLNYYYSREATVLLEKLPADIAARRAVPFIPVFLEVDIQGIIEYVGNSTVLHHKNYVTYCNKINIPETVFPATNILD